MSKGIAAREGAPGRAGDRSSGSSVAVRVQRARETVGGAVVGASLRIRDQRALGRRHLRRGLGGEGLGPIPKVARTARPLLRVARRDVHERAARGRHLVQVYEALKFLRTHIPSSARSAPPRRRPRQASRPPSPHTWPLSLMNCAGGGTCPTFCTCARWRARVGTGCARQRALAHTPRVAGRQPRPARCS